MMPRQQARDRLQERPPRSGRATTKIAIGASIQGEDSWAWRAASLRGEPSKHDARQAHEGDRGQASDQGEEADGQEGRQAAAAAGRQPALHQAQVHQPFADEAVQGRQCRDVPPPRSSWRAPVHGILFINPPSFSMSFVPVPCSTLPAARNIRPFIRAWFQMWSSPAAIAQHGHDGHRRWPHPTEPDAQGQADQPHVLDAGVGEHSLHVSLVQGQRDPDQGREQAECTRA